MTISLRIIYISTHYGFEFTEYHLHVLSTSPFIIVSYFTLHSIFNQDLKGIIYLVGLIVTTVVIVLIASIMPEAKGVLPDDGYAKIKCTQLTLGKNYPISKLPLSQTVFGYTLAYLSYFIGINNLQTQTSPRSFCFPSLF